MFRVYNTPDVEYLSRLNSILIKKFQFYVPFFKHVDMQILNVSLHEYSLFDNTNKIFNNTGNRIFKLHNCI